MGISREDAFDTLELPVGADLASIRTNYKRLAVKWHPEKHNHSQESRKTFTALSTAYKVLLDDDYDTDEDDSNLNMADVFDVFQQAFTTTNTGPSSNGYISSGPDEDFDEDEDEDDEELISGATFFDILSSRFRPANQKPAITQKRMPGLSAEQIEKNANELISEEEKEKRKAEKRRAKKKRRREKKRIEKEAGNQDLSNGIGSKEDSKKSKNSKKKEQENGEDDFDPSSAFFTKVVNKKKKTGVLVEPQVNISVNTQSKPVEEEEDVDPVILRSRQLAIHGNQMAQVGEYKHAIGLFTDAIRLYPKDFRFFGNRSYCYDRLEQYDKALRDADTAINLDPGWAKGYFRKGRALAGLKLYAEAEQAFMQVVKLDKLCQEANDELKCVRTHQIMEMGFTKLQAEAALKQCGSVQEALDSLLMGTVDTMVSDMLASDEEETLLTNFVNATSISRTHMTPAPLPSAQQLQNPDSKMDPSNPEGLTALWVGNVLPEVNDKKLTQLFSKYGTVTKVRCLPEKFCAFINFTSKEAAGKAMRNLQGTECGGQKLLIKFPDNPVANASLPVRKPQSLKPSQIQTIPRKADLMRIEDSSKPHGPVNGDECYFWRTTGCDYGNHCKYRHIPTHKGIDKKPWHK